QAQSPAEREAPGLLGEERVGPALDDEAVAALRADRPADAVRRLQQGEVERASALARQLDRAVRRRQARDASARDDQPHRDRLGASALARQTRSASIAMKAGWSFAARARWNPRPSSEATRRASTSRSYSTSTWSATNPMGDTTTSATPSRTRPRSASPM